MVCNVCMYISHILVATRHVRNCGTFYWPDPLILGVTEIRVPPQTLTKYSGTSLIWTPLGQKRVSLLVRCPDFRGCNVPNKAPNRVFGTVKCVLFIKVSSFQGVLIREVPFYMCVYNFIYTSSKGPLCVYMYQ